MIDSAGSFAERCKDAAEQFLQTVVVIDNEAGFDGGFESANPKVAQRARIGLAPADIGGSVASVEPPTDKQGRFSTTSATGPVDRPAVTSKPPQEAVFSNGPSGMATVAPIDPPDVPVSHRLDAKALTDAFGDRSVLCTVYKPEPGERMVERAAKIASHADIVVVDWYLEPGSSVMAKEIISDILQKDAERNGRLRLIAVYTAQSDMARLAGELRDYLETRELRFDNPGDGILSAPGVRIVFLQKAGGGMLASPGSLNEAELPTRLIGEFAELSAGILSMVALRSIAALREGSHHILSTFHPGLDAAFVLHRCLLPHPEDAESFAVGLIAAELGALLGANDIGRHADLEVMKKWVAAHLPRPEGFPFGTEVVSTENVRAWLELGGEADVGLSKKAVKKTQSHLGEALYGNAEAARNGCLELARISCLKREAHSRRSAAPGRPPMLSLGTIVRPLQNGRGEYPRGLGPDTFLLCIQPACDSVRIRGERPYPFQRLKRADDCFNVVVRLRDQTNATLQVSGFPHLTEMVTFRSVSAQEDFVLPREADGRFVFTDVEGNQFEWLADLNDFTAQWAMAQIGARVNTPGLDRFEWLRLKGKATD